MLKLTFICCFIAVFAVTLNAQWQKQNIDTKASLRGLSVVNSNVIWASGTGGTVLRTIDGGKNWQVLKVPDTEKLDFRDIEAFDAETAYILSIGEGENSRIYKTTDGGKTWKMQFKNTNPKAFFDALAFWDKTNGMAMSDPVDGKYLLIKTTDGENWNVSETAQMPSAKTGEAAFAASGTCLLSNGKNGIFLISGGNDARVFRSEDRGMSWTVSDSPVTKGTAGSGIFSIAMRDNKNGVIVGGNYEKPNDITNNLAFTNDGGKSWKLAKGLNGYRSGVAYIDKKTILAVGSSGSDISTDNGKSWKNLDKENYNAVQAKSKNAIWAVGVGGLVSRFEFSKTAANNTSSLYNRINLYHSYIETAKYDKLWNLTSRNFKAENDNDKSEYVAYIQKHNFSSTKMKYSIISTDNEKNIGKAVVEIKLLIENKWISETWEETWVYENGDWFFENYQTLKADSLS